jgi:hypothetical protein
MKQLITHQEILDLNISQEYLVTKFLEQLRKDFDTCGVGSFFKDLSSPLNYELLVAEVNSALLNIEKQGYSVYNQLLYRVDVPEKEIARVSAMENKNAAIAEIIIKRILQKVILKIQFSKK